MGKLTKKRSAVSRNGVIMPKFFVRQDRIGDNKVTIIGDDAFHISRALRMAKGEHITVCDMQCNEYD